MEKYKYSKYIIKEEIDNGKFLYYSSVSNQFLLFNEKYSEKLESLSPLDLEEQDNQLFYLLCEKKFIIPIDLDETKYITKKKYSYINEKNWYHIVVNTTLDCNLNCWYCYENRIKGSKITKEVCLKICKNITAHYQNNPYELLKISFFGGEPFLYWKGIREIIDFSTEFCKKKSIGLLLDFTTNATLIDEPIIDYLSNYQCNFQITLDGAEKKHNAIKNSNIDDLNCYNKTIETLKLIDKKIDKRLIAVRINFDKSSLHDIDQILKDISFLDRKKSYIIVKKVWQINTQQVDREIILDVIQKIFDLDFLVDYYVMPKGGVCFAERKNQALFNYDGKIFKCTTISNFDERNTLGCYSEKTGLIKWEKNKIKEWTRNMQQKECLVCKWYGACYGPCNKQLIKHKNKFICTFDSMNLTNKEYLIYLFKYNLLYRKLFSK